MIFFHHPLVDVEVPPVRSKLIRVILNENTLLLSNLLHDGGYIVTGKFLSSFQDIEYLDAPYALVNTAVLVEVAAVWMLLNFPAV